MGMFDTIICERELPNLPEELIWLHGSAKDVDFQTKDLDNALDTFKINENGELLRHKIRHELISEGDPNGESIADRLPQYDYIDEGWEKTKITSEVVFYTSYDYEEKTDRCGWVEYKAIFFNGLLQGEIELIEHSLPRNNTPEESAQMLVYKEEAQARRQKHNEEQIALIEDCKKRVEQLAALQDFIYENLLDKINITKQRGIEPWIFDYVFNDNEHGLEHIKNENWI